MDQGQVDLLTPPAGFLIAGCRVPTAALAYGSNATVISSPGGSALNAQVRLFMSAANEMQDETHQSHNKKDVNQYARYMKNNPTTNPGDH
jgi:hypothetical protein